MDQTTQALAIQQDGAYLLNPRNLDEAMRLADMMAASDIVPTAYKGKSGNILIAVQMGIEIGLTPMSALQGIAVINGRPGIFGDAGKALLLRAGCKIEEDDAEIVRKSGMGRCKITRPNGMTTERTFSIEDATTAGLWKKTGPWTQYPMRMLAWRAFWFAARDGASDLLKGMAGIEEIRDIPPEKDMGNAEEVPGARAAAVSDLLNGRKPEPEKVVPPTLDGVLNLLKTATTPDEMATAAGAAANLANDADKEIGRNAYKARMAELKAAAKKAAAGAAPTFAEIADGIDKAETREQLDFQRSRIKDVADAEQRAELTQKLDGRMADLRAPA